MEANDPILTGFDPVVAAEKFRETLGNAEKLMREYVDILKSTNIPLTLHDRWECIAQAMLALRHTEDARMRFGKVIQYANTGESCYKK